MIRSPLRRRLAALALLVLPVAACLDGPFAHANPHDGESEITLAVVGGADTLRVVGDAALFQLVTTPVTSGFTVQWESSAPLRLAPIGLGRFVLVSHPPTVTTVQVTARMGANSATRDVVLLPAP